MVFSSPLSFFLFLLLPNTLLAQTYANISLGTALTPLAPPTSWPSPSGDFAFGFRPLVSDTSLFLLAIFFNKLPNKTIIWTANGDKPVTNMSKAQLTTDGQLSLKDSTGKEIWNANVNTATHASMLDTGNFILSSTGSGTIWQTFDNPTDTIMPGQVLKQGTKIFAKLMDDDYSRGRFELTLQEDGNLVLYPVAYPSDFAYTAYWSSMSEGSGTNHLMFNESNGSIYLSYANGSMISVLVAPDVSGDNYLKATLDPDGVFRSRDRARG